MWFFDKRVKRTSAATTTDAPRMMPYVGPTKFAPRKAAPPPPDPAEDTLSGVTLKLYEVDEGDDPYNHRSGTHRIR